MTTRSILYTATGALRTPWRLLVLYAAFIGFTLPMMLVYSAVPDVGGAVVDGVLAGCAAIAMLAATRWTLRRFGGTWRDVWMGRDAAEPRDLALGAGLGILPIAIPSLVLVLVGWLRFAPSAAGSSIAAGLLAAVVLLPAAFFEELFSRGYALRALRDALGWWPAIALTSVPFGLLHMWNPGATALSIGLVTLAGFFLGAVVMATGSLWAATLAHFFWNWTMAALLHAPVSGLGLPTPDYRLLDAGPDWLTGGSWGPEGGAGAAFGMLAGTGYLYARWKRRREET